MSPAPGGLDSFEGERARLTGLAYRITGSLADAEDVVQEVWIRWAARDAATVDNPAGWLTTVTSRLALDYLRAQRRRREVYVGPWLPDPVHTARDAEETAELAESLTLGFLVLLDSLGPYERVAFLLGDVFGEPYPAIARILGKSETACRQLVSRARRKLHSARSGAGTPPPSPASAELLAQLMYSRARGRRTEDREPPPPRCRAHIRRWPCPARGQASGCRRGTGRAAIERQLETFRVQDPLKPGRPASRTPS